MKTSLLSLTIHDSLTFDGTELCLHPDLFAISSDAFASSQRATSTTNISSRKASPDDPTSGKGSGTNTSASINSGNTTAGSTMGLAVGDMIEIRVWDPLPKEQAILKSSGNTTLVPAIRKAPRTSPPGAQHTTGSVQVEFPTPSTSNVPVTSTVAVNGKVGSALNSPTSTTLRPRADSLVYSVGDTLDEDIIKQATMTTTAATTIDPLVENAQTTKVDQVSVTAESSASGENDNDSVDQPPTKAVAMSTSLLPPVFPRARANTTDGPTAVTPGPTKTHSASNSILPKPPLIHRRIPSAAGALSSQQQQQQISPKLIRGHSRQISDMTMDTQNLDIMEGGIQHMDSQDDDIVDHGVGGVSWSKVSTTHKLRLSFVLLVTEKTLTSLKGNTRTQISMLRQVADLYSLSSYDMVTVHKIDPHDEDEVLKAVSADFVVMTIKDQFISRGDMHWFQRELQGSWIYEGQRLMEKTRQIKAHALEIRHGNDAAKSGIVTEKTMITFRSRSARIIWLVQLSSEMWDYASPYDHKGEPESTCEIYFDQWIRFLYKLFEKWKALEVTHSLTVIFFSRTILANGHPSPLNCRDVYGRSYEDHYKPVIENETCTEWESLIVRIKEEFVKYPIEVGWNLTHRRPSSASQGNVLEAVNATLNIMQFHFLDRDLYRTGNSIVVVSPGCGVFEVDKELAGITYQRMMDNGIGSDMLSLGLPPLHIAPFFLYNNEFRTVDTKGVDTSETYYEVPHWMHLSFVSYDREEHQLGDHIHHDSMVSPKIMQNGLESFERGPNGFLRRKTDSSIGPSATHHTSLKQRAQMSTFSALGNRAATPGKAKSQQERQLISGRDFRDILEACRPRVSGMGLPSALVSLLKFHEFAQEKERARLGGGALRPKSDFSRNHHKHAQIREWGTVHFNEFPVRPKTKSSICDSPTSRRSSSDANNDKTDNSETESNASSFMSHVSSVFGMSYDRVIWDHYDSPVLHKTSFMIQRSQSLDFDKVAASLGVESESGAIDDAISVGTDNVSLGQASSGDGDREWNQADNDTMASHPSKQEKHVESLKRLMEAHDEQVWAPKNAILGVVGDINVIRPESIQHVESEVTLSSTKLSQVRSGGLGAALTQYSNTFSKDSQSSTRLTRRASGSFLSTPGRGGSGNKERFRTQSPLLPTLTSRGMSPMLLPSMLSLPGQHHGLFEPPLNLKSDQSKGFVTQRSLGLESNPSIPGDGLNQLGMFSASNFEYRGFQNTMGPSFPQVDTRHLIRPVPRSPPSSRPRQYSSSSAIGAVGAVGGSARGAPHGFLSISPPSSGVQRQVPSRTIRKESSSPPGITEHQTAYRPGSPSSKRGSDFYTTKSIAREKQGTSKHSMRQPKACNPFRQSDEDEVLAKKSHNRRRWSHVFPAGEVEFKRHSGPIWNSLTAPAILPLSVDYFPSPQELKDEGTFQFNPYTVTLSGIENKHYSTHAELMMEMVRQRVAQDYQIVTEDAVKDSESRSEPQRIGRNKGKGRVATSRRDTFVPSLPSIKHDMTGTIKHYLSMGHRIQVLSYDPSSDTIEIVHYNRKSAQNDPINVYNYRFMVYSRFTEGYVQSIQTFKKYAEPYKWNKVDNIICGEEDRQLEVGMRFRRLMFGLIPEAFKNEQAERDYIAKFQRLLEYLGKLREKPAAENPLDVSIVTSADKKTTSEDIFKVRRPSEDSMIKFTIPLRRGKRDPFEWMEIALGSTFDSSCSYRIMFNWLVASSAKVEAQVQLLHRRCTQFGLYLVSFPQTTISRDLFLHTFAVPTFFTVRDKEKSDVMAEQLNKMDFVDDGIRFTYGHALDFIEHSHEFDFPKYRNGKWKSIPSRQYVHRSGALFVRMLRDRQGWSILVGIENYRHANKENNFRETALDKLRELAEGISVLSNG